MTGRRARTVSGAITRFHNRHPYWDRPFAADVLRETRRAARSIQEFATLTGLPIEDALVLWTSGREAREEIAA
jgi:hypothetical protein